MNIVGKGYYTWKQAVQDAAYIYISGPMRGYFDHNRQAFKLVRQHIEGVGGSCYDPVKNSTGDFDVDFAHDLRVLADVTGLIALPGWRDSQGATVEVSAALVRTIPVWEVDWLTVEAEQDPSADTYRPEYPLRAMGPSPVIWGCERYRG